jgi:hypothetical protein
MQEGRRGTQRSLFCVWFGLRTETLSTSPSLPPNVQCLFSLSIISLEKENPMLCLPLTCIICTLSMHIFKGQHVHGTGSTDLNLDKCSTKSNKWFSEKINVLLFWNIMISNFYELVFAFIFNGAMTYLKGKQIKNIVDSVSNLSFGSSLLWAPHSCRTLSKLSSYKCLE